jgi:hypothetical protein
VEMRGKVGEIKVFHTLRPFSTYFPQSPVDTEAQ